jgi:hypothetical protein
MDRNPNRHTEHARKSLGDGKDGDRLAEERQRNDHQRDRHDLEWHLRHLQRHRHDDKRCGHYDGRHRHGNHHEYRGHEQLEWFLPAEWRLCIDPGKWNNHAEWN